MALRVMRNSARKSRSKNANGTMIHGMEPNVHCQKTTPA